VIVAGASPRETKMCENGDFSTVVNYTIIITVVNYTIFAAIIDSFMSN